MLFGLRRLDEKLRFPFKPDVVTRLKLHFSICYFLYQFTKIEKVVINHEAIAPFWSAIIYTLYFIGRIFLF